MKVKSDRLAVSFDSSLDDEAGLCVSREVDGIVDVLKMELGEQADILYRLLTDQTAKAEIKAESEQNDDIENMLEHLWNDTADEESEVESCSSNFIQLKQDVLNNKQLWRKLREIEDEDSD